MFNCRRILTGLTVAALVMSAGMARADDRHVVSLTCRGTEVRKAIEILQRVSDLRVLVDPKVPHNRITLSVNDLPPEDALKTVVAAAGLTFRKFGNAFLVEPRGGGTLSAAAARAALESQEGQAGSSGAAPGPASALVRPDAPPPVAADPQPAPAAVAPEVQAALGRTVNVDVKDGALTEVLAQLSRSAGVPVTADAHLSAGLVATVGLHGIQLWSALELVAEQTGLQIAPQANGIAFVTPGISLEAAQARARRAPAGARHVDRAQLWTAAWANVLSSGFSAFDGVQPHRSLRRQSLRPDGRPLEFKPRLGGPRLLARPAAPKPGLKARGAEKKAARPASHPART